MSSPKPHGVLTAKNAGCSNRRGRKERRERQKLGEGSNVSSPAVAGAFLTPVRRLFACLSLPRPRRPLRSPRSLRLRHASTYGNRRLWITFWREFWGGCLGDFWKPTGLGAGVRGVFVRKPSETCPGTYVFLALFSAFLPPFCPLFTCFHPGFRTFSIHAMCIPLCA